MKNLIRIFMILVSLAFLSGCSSFKGTADVKTNTDLSGSSNSPANQSNINHSIKDYFPFNENAKYIYEGKENKTLDYYALNVGLIKTVYDSKDAEMTSTLSKVETNSPLTQNIKFYYVNGSDDKIYAVSKNLSFNTNDITRTVFEKYFKESPSKGLGRLISPNTKINSLYLNKDNVVYVDFSKELVSEMNAGAGFEQKILQCITNTLGNYYGVDKVYITIENKPYSSGHYVMKQGEAFKVDIKN